MDILNALLRNLVGGFLAAAGVLDPSAGLVVMSLLAGMAMLWVFGKTSDQEAIARTKKLLQAYLLELRLFGDDLGIVWQAQKNLFTGNVRYVGLMLKPALYLTIPLLVLLIHLDAYYGRSPLRVGEAAVVTLKVNGRLASNAPAPVLKAPPEIAVETAPVRVIESGEISWRIRATKPVDGQLRFAWLGKEWTKSVVAGDGPRYVSGRRVTGVWDALWDPGESRFAAGEVDSIEVRYPFVEMDLFGLRLHWLIWFFVISMVSAFLLKGRFKVVF